MTEIQWIVNLMLNHPMSDDMKKLCLERISEVESKFSQPKINQNILPASLNTYVPPIGPSATTHIPPPVSMPLQAPITVEALKSMGDIVTGGGNGTSIRGPNKMRGRL